MAKSLFDASWYRVADLRLRLRGHAEIHRQRFRGEIWYVLQDHQTGRFHRLSPSANLMVSLLDGRRTLDEVWNLVGSRCGDDPPTQEETIRLLAQLHSSDLLQGEVPPDIEELSERSSKQARSDLLSRLRNPLALRFPLFDPDRFLEATMPLVRPLFTVWGFLAWLTLVGAGLTLAVLNWSELTADSTDRLFSATNLLLIALTYPVIKALHEAGHAYATKVWGGAVHEVGIMMLVMLPAPYVDATSATAFREKWRRIIVSGAGIMVEFGLAAAAMIFWVNAEPGLARAAAFNVMLIGSVSTLFFNGNPLLRFDAYYILTDLIEIPNFGTRANRFFWFLVQRHLLGVEGLENPASAPGEAKWLLVYAVLAFFYRVVLSLTIALLVAGQLFFVGVALAAFTLFNTFVSPVFKGLKYLFFSPRLANARGRPIGVTLSFVGALAALFFLAPLPYATVAQGVVWAPDGAELRPLAAGIVTEVLSVPDSLVAAGDPLVRLSDPTIDGRVALLEAQRRELALRYDGVRFSDRVEAQVLNQQIANVDAILAATRQRQAGLLVSAPGAGRFVLPMGDGLVGRFVRQGERLGYVVPAGVPALRVVVPQDVVDLVRGRTERVDIRYATALEQTVPARIVREVPGASVDLPSLALATQGGGDIASSGQGADARAIQGLFVFDVAPERAAGTLLLGARAFIRFDHGQEPVAWRLLRATRQLFLSQFNV